MLMLRSYLNFPPKSQQRTSAWEMLYYMHTLLPDSKIQDNSKDLMRDKTLTTSFSNNDV